MTSQLSKYQPQVNNEDAAQLTKGFQGFPQIRLCSGQSKVAGQSNIPIGRFYLSNQDESKAIPLGTFDKDTDGKKKGIIEVGMGIYRFHAMRLVNNQVEEESFNNKDSIWNKIVRDADNKVQGAMYGFDFLFFIPPHMIKLDQMEDQTARAEFDKQFKNGTPAVLFYKATSRQFAPITVPPGSCLRIKSTQIVTPKYSWWVPGEREIIKADWFNEQMLLAPAQSFNNIIPEVLESAPEGSKVVSR